MAGGGGGEEDLRETGLSAMRTGSRHQVVSTPEENSLLPGGLTSERQDRCALPGRPAANEGALEVMLRQTGGREVDVHDLGLGFVDHAEGMLAVSSVGGVLVGYPGDALTVAGSGVENGSDLASGAGSSYWAEGGESVEVDLGLEPDIALLLEARGDVSGVNADSVGILVQRLSADSTWVTFDAIHPRREFAFTAVPADGEQHLRLVFLRKYEVRSVRRLSGIRLEEIEPLSLVAALHSRLGPLGNGENSDSTTLVPGDSLRLRFANDEGTSSMRDYFVTARGEYRVAQKSPEPRTTELAIVSKPVLTFALAAARPNPSSGDIVIAYSIARDSHVDLRIFDVAGRQVRSLVNDAQIAGEREVVWDGHDSAGRRVAPGVYFYRLRAGSWQSERKLIVIQ